MFDAVLLTGQPFMVASSGKEKDKQISRKSVETVSEQLQRIAQNQGVYTIVSQGNIRL